MGYSVSSIKCPHCGCHDLQSFPITAGTMYVPYIMTTNGISRRVNTPAKIGHVCDNCGHEFPDVNDWSSRLEGFYRILRALVSIVGVALGLTIALFLSMDSSLLGIVGFVGVFAAFRFLLGKLLNSSYAKEYSDLAAFAEQCTDNYY